MILIEKFFLSLYCMGPAHCVLLLLISLSSPKVLFMLNMESFSLQLLFTSYKLHDLTILLTSMQNTSFSTKAIICHLGGSSEKISG